MPVTLSKPSKLSPEQARELSYSWHGGMWSPLYAFASSGIVKDIRALQEEVSECRSSAFIGPSEKAKLEALSRFIDTLPKGSDPNTAKAPWAR